MSEYIGKKIKKTSHEWEEAGSEFYQERYNGELENVNKKSCPITTLLPSKQIRIGTSRKTYDGNKGKLWQSTNSVSQKKYTKVDNSSQIPDLSEVSTDEESIWRDILQIKLLTINMSQKREIKLSLQKATKLRLQGFQRIRWQKRKLGHQVKATWLSIQRFVELWRNSLKTIESNFGTGALAYFLFIRWIFFLNCGLFLISFLFLILPSYMTIGFRSESCEKLVNHNQTLTKSCFSGENEESIFSQYFQYAKILKCTLLFYSGYQSSNATHLNQHALSSPLGNFNFHPAMAFLIAFIICFCASFTSIARAAVREFKEKIIYCKMQLYPYSCIIFSSWDFCIKNRKAAMNNQKAIANELELKLLSKKIYFERYNRTRNYLLELIAIRIVINIFIIITIILTALCLYIVFEDQFKLEEFIDSRQNSTTICDSTILVENSLYELEYDQAQKQSVSMLNEIFTIFKNFHPYILLVLVNNGLPLIFAFISKAEKYSPVFNIKINLCRSILIRSSSLGIFLFRIYKLAAAAFIYNNNIEHRLKSGLCWEMNAGELFYKLIIVEFLCQFFVTFCINFPKMLLYNNTRKKIIAMLSSQQFEVWKHVLDVVYLQAVCWLGIFCAPFLSLLTAVFIFLLFYIKKFQCLINSKPSKILCGPSKSNSLFMLILLITYCIIIVIFFYALTELRPSINCGPFANMNSVWETPIQLLNENPPILKHFLSFITNTKVIMFVFFLLCVSIYYFYIKSDANKQMVDVLKNQLILEGHDKQFLLTRLTYFLNQQKSVPKIETSDQINT